MANKIDLSTCKKGQKLRNRGGELCTYVGPAGGYGMYTGDIHYIINHVYRYPVFDNGRGNKGILPQDDVNSDIVEILSLEEEIPILAKISTIDDVEFQMWDNVNKEYYDVVPSVFARQLEDNNHKLIEENKGLLYRIKQLEGIDDDTQIDRYIQLLIKQGWNTNAIGAWVNPNNGYTYTFEEAITFLWHLKSE